MKSGLRKQIWYRIVNRTSALTVRAPILEMPTLKQNGEVTETLIRKHRALPQHNQGARTRTTLYTTDWNHSFHLFETIFVTSCYLNTPGRTSVVLSSLVNKSPILGPMNLHPFSPEMRMGCPLLPELRDHGGLRGDFWPLPGRWHRLREALDLEQGQTRAEKW